MNVINQCGLSSERLSEVEALIPAQENLKDLMEWAQVSPASFIPQVVANVIVQDEFTHDVIVPWRDGLVLVYDTT